MRLRGWIVILQIHCSRIVDHYFYPIQSIQSRAGAGSQVAPASLGTRPSGQIARLKPIVEDNICRQGGCRCPGNSGGLRLGRCG